MREDAQQRELGSLDQESMDEVTPGLDHLSLFQSQGMRPSDFNTAMVHFYRAEINRSNTWRQRLDATTNWAVVTTAAALSLAFSGVTNQPTLILINTLLVVLFLFIEARRYRYYELWASRVRLLETNYFASMLTPLQNPDPRWAEKISSSLVSPKFPISLLEALGRRYRRNYAPIFLILAISWIFKVIIHPYPVRDFPAFLERASVGAIPGWAVLSTVVFFNFLLIALGFFTVGLRASTAEVLEPEPVSSLSSLLNRMGRGLRKAVWETLEVDLHPPAISVLQPRKQLAIIISDEVQGIGKALIQRLNRGVTLLHGTGLYTGREHGVLMCAIESRQVRELKHIVYESDPHAFVMVTPLQDVLGEGFRPLEA